MKSFALGPLSTRLNSNAKTIPQRTEHCTTPASSSQFCQWLSVQVSLHIKIAIRLLSAMKLKRSLFFMKVEKILHPAALLLRKCNLGIWNANANKPTFTKSQPPISDSWKQQMRHHRKKYQRTKTVEFTGNLAIRTVSHWGKWLEVHQHSPSSLFTFFPDLFWYDMVIDKYKKDELI